MIRFLGSVFILGGGVLGVCFQAKERRRRQETLRKMAHALRGMAEEIRMARTPLPRLLESCARTCGGETGDFFDRVSEAVRSGEMPDTAWRREAEGLSLHPSDKRVLCELELQGDEEKICNGILLVTEQLTKSAEEQKRNAPQDAKRTAALWVSAAAFLVILLI